MAFWETHASINKRVGGGLCQWDTLEAPKASRANCTTEKPVTPSDVTHGKQKAQLPWFRHLMKQVLGLLLSKTLETRTHDDLRAFKTNVLFQRGPETGET